MTTFPKKLMLLGSGELGKEVVIAAKRLGCEVVACDRYPNAPAMQISDKSEVLDMTNGEKLKEIVNKHKPDFVIPEIEALAVDALAELEEAGLTIIPTARATAITMNRDLIRNLAADELKLKTARFFYANSAKELDKYATEIGFPVVIKPIMSSSGKGQSLVTQQNQIADAWKNAISNARGKSSKVIIEEFVKFDLEITLLTIRQKNGSTLFCPPIGHVQKNGDYQCSWQPASINEKQLKEAHIMAKKITDNLHGVGLFGVEFFINENEVIFSELSPRPHDTGLVTLLGQNFNEFELHLKAILGLPIPSIKNTKAAASRVILADESIEDVGYLGLEKALIQEDTEILLFGKQSSKKGRRMGVALASGEDTKQARKKADEAASLIKVINRKNQRVDLKR